MSTHESAVGHVTGSARYVDDLPEPEGTLHAVIVASPIAHGTLRGIDAAPALALPGVHAVIVAADIPGDPHVGPIVHDEPLLAIDAVHTTGQAVAMVLADTREQARIGADAVALDLEALPAVLTIDEAVASNSFHTDPHVIARGDVEAALDAAHLVIRGEVRTPAQDHFYLETQCALAVPTERAGLHIWSSTQHPTEVQHMAAQVLGIAQASVTCEVPRMGGAFGGKESQATQPACLAALGAWRTGRPVKVWLDRGEDMRNTGKRHPFLGRYRAGFGARGTLLALEATLFSDGGWSADLSGPVLDRGLFHLDNAYHVPALRFEGRVARTNLPSNTAFRGFGGPQGICVVEDAIEQAARHLGMSAWDVRRRSYYAAAPRDRAPYGQRVPEPRIGAMHDQLCTTANITERQAEIAAFNAASVHHKRGLGHMPVKFGISFTASHLNQAGALVNVYSDGTVQLNHGGTEMGQGLHTKMIEVCADTLGVPTSTVRNMDTRTDKVPNTSATAASSGTDLNGQAVRAACETIRARMAPVAAELLELPSDEDVRFVDGHATAGGRSVAFSEAAAACCFRQISLSSTGFYRTPGIAYDRKEGQGTPFFYFAWGVAFVEVEVAGLTGEHRVRRVDILHDVGDSLVPEIDVGQVEGAFVQGMGWLTGEEVLFDDHGRCITHGPSTYKVPAVGDVPLDLRVQLLDRATQADTIGGSKAVGEPPFMLAIGVVHALRDAIAAFGAQPVELALPASPEAILRAVEAQRS